MVIASCLCMATLLTGCDVNSMLPNRKKTSAEADLVGATILDDGRKVGGYMDGRIGDTLPNAFFSYTVNDAYITGEFEGQVPAEGMSFLVAELSVKNTFGAELDMWSSDFQLQWGEEDTDFGYPIEFFHESQMPDEFSMKKGETTTKLCVYEIPTPDAEIEYSISFLEYYADDVEGNVFFVYFDLKPAE